MASRDGSTVALTVVELPRSRLAVFLETAQMPLAANAIRFQTPKWRGRDPTHRIATKLLRLGRNPNTASGESPGRAASFSFLRPEECLAQSDNTTDGPTDVLSEAGQCFARTAFPQRDQALGPFERRRNLGAAVESVRVRTIG